MLDVGKVKASAFFYAVICCGEVQEKTQHASLEVQLHPELKKEHQHYLILIASVYELLCEMNFPGVGYEVLNEGWYS